MNYILVFQFINIFLFPTIYSKSIHISLQANFLHRSLLAQAAEFFAGIESNIYWDFYKFVISNCSHSTSDQDDYDCSVNFSLHYLTQPLTQLLNYALTVQFYAPKIEMYHQIARSSLQSKINLDSENIFLDICDKKIVVDMNEAEKIFQSPFSCSSKKYSFDHDLDSNSISYQFSTKNRIQAILYGNFGSKETNDILLFLKNQTINGSLKGFLFRPWYPIKKGSFALYISGYGIELAIKSTEYLAKDDSNLQNNENIKFTKAQINEFMNGLNFTLIKFSFPSENVILEKFQNHLYDTELDVASSKQWQWNDLGFQICQLILNSYIEMREPALTNMIHIIQYFPVKSKNLHILSVSRELRHEIVHNQHIFAAIGIDHGESIFLLNGKRIPDLDIFTFFELFTKELFLMSSIHASGISPDDIFNFLNLELNSSPLDYALDVRDKSIFFINDIEKDKEYALWTQNVQELLRPTFPGIIRQIRRNFFNLIFFFDPSEDLSYTILMVVNAFLSNFQALRIGFLMKPRDQGELNDAISSECIYSCFNYIMLKNSNRDAFNWLLKLFKETHTKKVKLNIDNVDAFCYSHTGHNATYLINEFGNFEQSVKFFQASGLNEFPSVLFNGVQLLGDFFSQNLSSNLAIEKLIAVINNIIAQQTRILQEDIYFGKLLNQMDVYNFIMTKPNVVKRLNYRILAPHSSNLNFFCIKNPSITIFDDLSLLNSCQILHVFLRDTPYIFNPKSESTTKTLSIWLAVDFSSEVGFQMFKESLEYISRTNRSRFALIFTSAKSKEIDINKIFKALVYSHSEALLFTIFSRILEVSNYSNLTLEFVIDTFSNFSWFNNVEFMSILQNSIIDSNFFYLSSFVLNLTVTSRVLIVNGRILGPLDLNEQFTYSDFVLLEDNFYLNNGQELLLIVDRYISSQQSSKVGKNESLFRFKSDMILKIVSSHANTKYKDNRMHFPIEELSSNYSMFNLKPRLLNELYFIVDVVVDPLTKQAQKSLPIILELYNMLNIHLRVWLSPRQRISEFPLNRFYKYVLGVKPNFLNNGSLSRTEPHAEFVNLPNSPLLTLALDVPHVWMVEAIFSNYDIDNIHMENVAGSVVATFKLSHILLEGQCLDYSTHSSVPGIHLTLDSEFKTESFDSLVMANLGYFQLKSQPGIWKLRLVQGIDTLIMRQQGGEEIQSENTVLIGANSFNGKFLELYVSTKEKDLSFQEKNNLVTDEKYDSTLGKLWYSFSDYFPKFEKSDDLKSINVEKVINIFSIASGHLYERFLRIMMLSVLKNTQSPVKFWLLKNYLSPQFKKFIPLFAERYEFSYEFIEYKWPKWLRTQEQKQRVIWGYKILFLDVLFPINIKKIIYVDADQVVRANLLELVDMDLHGAPYGYVPFCDSKKEMDGFRFWKHGYWENLLRHRKYHISALYVVDLIRFREIAAGDRLRENYQALSHDPNSLANLDQDLPNSMIHSVPIFSLPQNWLWCETWCSEDEKLFAKTIDMCNNPLTKEPKLNAAKRIIEEWMYYDDEITKFFKNNSISMDSKDKDLERHIEL